MFESKDMHAGGGAGRALFPALLLLGFSSSSTVAQEAPAAPVRRAWTLVPSLTVQETFTDNARVTDARKESDWITEIAPAVRIKGQSARAKLSLDYRLRNLMYANESAGNQIQNSLNMLGSVEAVEQLLFVDVSGNISQQQISAFGGQSAENYSINANSTEQRTFRVSPYIKGRLANYAGYELRYSDTRSRADTAGVADVNSSAWSGRIYGATPLSALGWSADFSDQKTEYLAARSNDSQRWRGMLTYSILPQLKLSATAGQERNNYLSSAMTAYNTHGYGFEWRPAERTQASGLWEKRFFGTGHTITLSHRLPMSSVRYTDSRDVSVLPPQTQQVGVGTYYDMLFELFASRIPDEADRATAVNAFLATYGIPPGTVVVTDFIGAQATLSRRQELSYVIHGVRNVVTLSLVRGLDNRLGTAILVGINDFSSTSSVRQEGFNITWSHKLSALSTLGVNSGYSRSRSGDDLDLRTTQKKFSAFVTTRLGAKTHGSLTARRTEHESSTAPYTENAVTGAVTLEF